MTYKPGLWLIALNFQQFPLAELAISHNVPSHRTIYHLGLWPILGQGHSFMLQGTLYIMIGNILVAYSVFFVLGIKSVRSFKCLLCSLYFRKGSGPLDPRWQFVDC